MRNHLKIVQKFKNYSLETNDKWQFLYTSKSLNLIVIEYFNLLQFPFYSYFRYHGHLLLSHIIAKFAIHKRIVLQVFHSLLKAHAVEARNVVRQALEILTPSMPGRMEDGNTMLTHWTKKIILEEGHTGMHS